MKAPIQLFGQLAEVILDGKARRATKYLSESLTVKATFQGVRRQNDRTATVLFTIGSPNYKEREYIRKAKQSGQSFPIHHIEAEYPR